MDFNLQKIDAKYLRALNPPVEATLTLARLVNNVLDALNVLTFEIGQIRLELEDLKLNGKATSNGKAHSVVSTNEPVLKKPDDTKPAVG